MPITSYVLGLVDEADGTSSLAVADGVRQHPAAHVVVLAAQAACQ